MYGCGTCEIIDESMQELNAEDKCTCYECNKNFCNSAFSKNSRMKIKTIVFFYLNGTPVEQHSLITKFLKFVCKKQKYFHNSFKHLSRSCTPRIKIFAYKEF
uniref:Uncharacterized protein n=1 Tax=Meloidogyne hapla TaxID=6305 RepID=A0A1I8BGM8_MELHA